MKSHDLLALIMLYTLLLFRTQRIIAIPVSFLTKPCNVTVDSTGFELTFNLNASKTLKNNTASTRSLDKYKQRLKVRSDDTAKDDYFRLLNRIRTNRDGNTVTKPYHRMNSYRPEVDPTPITDYYPPNFPLSTVCSGTPIPYGDHKIMDWIRRERYSTLHQDRPFYMDLRKKMFVDANSEECHTPEYDKFLPYIECALLRNQRMEFEVPKYPIHQKDRDRSKKKTAKPTSTTYKLRI